MHRRWTKEEDEFLRINYKNMTREEKSVALNRTVNAINARCNHLGLVAYRHDPVQIGERFDRLVVVEKSKEKSNVESVFLCSCDCGNLRYAKARLLRSEQIRSCGCYGLQRAMELLRSPPGERTLGLLEYTYRRNAKNKNIVYELLTEDFRYLIQQECFWCGSPPKPHNAHCNANGTRSRASLVSPECIEQQWVNVNGIDRVDNSKLVGYIRSNSVSCCKNCNYAKGNKSMPDWCTYIERFQPGFTVKILEKLEKAGIHIPKSC